MTRKTKSDAPGQSKRSAASSGKGSRIPRDATTGRWPLQDAKARFSELVRRVKTNGPQLVTIHGREEVVIVSAEEFRRLNRSVTGQALIDVLQASPHRDVEIAPSRSPAPVRGVTL